MEERQQARMTATRWLDGRMNSLVEMVPGDPDCDACALARSYLRALEKIDRTREILLRMSPSQLNSLAQREIADEWPSAVQ